MTVNFGVQRTMRNRMDSGCELQNGRLGLARLQHSEGGPIVSSDMRRLDHPLECIRGGHGGRVCVTELGFGSTSQWMECVD